MEINQFSLASVFTDHMVFQQKSRIAIWGSGIPDQEVVVKFNDQIKLTTVDHLGHWKLFLEPMPASHRARTLTAVSGNKSLFLDNVCIGEVWLCSGQSNMGWSLGLTQKSDEYLKFSYNPSIRLLVVPSDRSPQPQSAILKSEWMPCQPDHCRHWSGVAYHFATRLYQELNVPIGIIWSSLGATKIQEWMSESMNSLHDYPNPEEWNQNPRAQLFNSMIAPLIPYTIKGVVWYQGEENHTGAGVYETLFSALIEDWRNRWQQGSFPFVYAQISSYGPNKDLPFCTWAEMQEAQLKSLAHPNTAMAVTIDVGEQDNIHPVNKQTVGDRLAIAALGKVYEIRKVYSGPLFKYVTQHEGYLKVYFDFVGDGLKTCDGESVKWIELAAEPENGSVPKFVPANAIIEKDHLVVRADNILHPAYVRYAYKNFPEGCNLVNSEFLPASPFRNTNDCSYSLGLGADRKVKQRPIAFHQLIHVKAGEEFLIDLSGRWSSTNWFDKQNIQIINQPEKGSLSLNGVMSSYKGLSHAVGTDSFTFKVIDESYESNEAIVVINFIENNAPRDK